MHEPNTPPTSLPQLPINGKKTPLIIIDKHRNVLDNPFVGYVCAKKAMSDRKAKKIPFSDCEIESCGLVLFGSHGAGLTNKRNFFQWQHVGENRVKSRGK